MVRNEGQRRDRAGKFLTAHDEGKLGALIGEIGLHIAKGDRRVQADDRLLATGMTRHVYVTREMQRARLPEKYFPMFGIATSRSE